MKKSYSFICLLLFTLAINAQNSGNNNFNLFNFRFANDVFFGTDRYFTNGFYFSLTSSSFENLEINNYFFPQTNSGEEIYTLGISHEIFTPQEKDSSKPVPGDRPFSANLFIVYVKNIFLQNEISWKFKILIGVTGKHAYGKEVQNGIHSLLPPSSDVRGWENQLSDALLMQYSINYYKTFYSLKQIKLRESFYAKIGQPKTSLGGGIIFIISNMEKLSRFYHNFSKLSWAINFEAKINYILLNSNLHGGLFTQNVYSIPYEDLKKFVFNFSNNVRLSLKKTTITFGYNFISKEYYGGKSHLWGFIQVGYLF